MSTTNTPTPLAAQAGSGDPEIWSDDYDDNVVCERCGGDGSVEYDDAPDAWGEDCPSEVNHLIACPDCGGSGIPGGSEDGILGRLGCLFPDECCMPGEHYTSECHTPEALMTPEEAKACRRWRRSNRRRWRRERRSPNKD